ncbi:MAG: DUF2520 domain-containing protein, partial [Actinobacteria bacterium]|nr:DUF2520 domain-containing protein [Actinomycetota bacterium]
MNSRPADGRPGPSLAGLRFAIIGAGRLGSSLALAMRARGAELAAFTCHTLAGCARAQEWLGTRAAADLADAVSTRPNLYVISVPDTAVTEVAENLAAAFRVGRDTATTAPNGPVSASDAATVVIHTSGVTSVEVLVPCAEAGAVVLAFHPLQTFSEPLSGAGRFAGAAIAVTPGAGGPGGSETALRAGFSLARSLDSRPFLLPNNKRVLYHAAACVASNYLVALEACAESMFVRTGMSRDEVLALFLPLVKGTLDNLAEQGTAAALTGPLSRGDTGTVAQHVR